MPEMRFFGAASVKCDSKNRIAIPLIFREAIAETQHDLKLLRVPGEKHFIVLFPKSFKILSEESLHALAPHILPMPSVAKDGRISLRQKWIEHMKTDDECGLERVVFVGRGYSIEIMSELSWDDAQRVEQPLVLNAIAQIHDVS